MAGLMKYKIFIIFGALMLAEGLVLFFMLGSSATSHAGAAEHADAHGGHASGHGAPAADAHGGGHGGGGGHGEAAGGHGPTDFLEFELGDFKISNNSVEGSPIRVDCKIFAEVPSAYGVPFKEAFDSKKHRVRDAVQAIIRGATYADVTDPDLGAVKRKLKKAITDVVGSEKPYISQIIVSDFQSYEL